MAKKTTKAATTAATAEAPRRRGSKATADATLLRIAQLGQHVRKVAMHTKEGDPSVEIPSRTLSNTRFNAKKRTLEMGDATQTRNLFNVGQARKFMQMMLQAAASKDLIQQDKTLSLRGMYYRSLHTIPGTKEKTFDDQSESDAILEDLEVGLGAMREELHVFAKKRGTMVGNITITDSGDEIDCRRMGSGGYAIPSICEPDVIRFGRCDAKFVLHVEKDTVWSRFNEDKFWQKHNCILTEGSGQPPRGVRRLLQRLNQELGLPIYCLLDCDPWGHYIYSVIKQGSINLAYESQRMAIPDAKFIGIRAEDYRRCELPPEVRIELNDKDTARAKQIAAYPWFERNRAWQKEIDLLLRNGFKMEVESLITKDISYVTETYVPARLKARDWLD
ncbi:MAG: DNA topoisomerase IV subunit A [Phycisphaerales bacterium]|nr:DNA topoisomerase IV subunit A [Phycisphaerales bacterium]